VTSVYKTDEFEGRVPRDQYKKEETAYEKTKVDGSSSNGYLIGRHPECGRPAQASTFIKPARLM
jgi:hypothetical protein